MFFIGPSGTGKTTTICELYSRLKERNKDPNIQFIHIDAKYSILGHPVKNAYVFVDNAQCLQQKPELVGYLKQCGISFCLAFSPLLAGNQGYSIFECGFHYTKLYNFRPFTQSEVDIYCSNNSSTKAVVEEMKRIGIFFPRILNQCASASSVQEWIHTTINNYVTKFKLRLQDASSFDELHTFLLKAAMEDVTIVRRMDNKVNVFYATWKDRPAVLKFTRTYGLDVHKYLADEQLAPEVYFHSILPGDWHVVIMERVGTNSQMQVN